MTKKEIKAFSIHQAFTWMIKTMEDEEDKELSIIKNHKRFINLDELDIDPELHEDFIRFFQDTGHVVGWCEKMPEENPNQIQTQVKDTIIKGDKKWKTLYLAVYDTPWGDEVVKHSKKPTKKECVDVAREAGQKENRDTFVLMGKSPDGFPRCSAQVLYKPSPKQQPGLYIFIW